jgi:hypothetical protein
MFVLLANLLTLVHGLLILCVITGAVAAMGGRLRRARRLETAYYSLLAAVIASDVLLGECLLTGLEKSVRSAYHPHTAFTGSYIHHYLPFLPPFIHTYIGPAIVAGALVAYPAWRLVDRSSGRITSLAATTRTEP